MKDEDFIKALPFTMVVICLLLAVVVGFGFGLIQLIHWLVP